MKRSLGMRLRRQAGSLLMEGFFNGLSAAGRIHPAANPRAHGLQAHRDIPYRRTGRKEHLLDVYRPSQHSGPLPVILYVHGGGFRILSKDTHWMMALAFARRGYVVFNINYRLAPKHPYPAAIEDTCAAYRWVLDHAAEYGGDPSRLIVAGESAGANLITSLTVATCYERPEPWARSVYDTGAVPVGAIPKCGLFQVSEIDRFARRYPHMNAFLVDRLQEVSDAYLGAAARDPAGGIELADPLVLLERGDAPARPLPPFLISVGTRDPLLDDSRRLDRAITSLGGTSAVHYYPGEVHAFQAMIWRRNARRYWLQVYRFLGELDGRTVLPAAAAAIR